MHPLKPQNCLSGPVTSLWYETWEPARATPVAFSLSSFPLSPPHSRPLTSWNPCEPGQTFLPNSGHPPLRTPLSPAVSSGPATCRIHQAFRIVEAHMHRICPRAILESLGDKVVRWPTLYQPCECGQVTSPLCTSSLLHVKCLSLSSTESLHGGKSSRALRTVLGT